MTFLCNVEFSISRYFRILNFTFCTTESAWNILYLKKIKTYNGHKIKTQSCFGTTPKHLLNQISSSPFVCIHLVLKQISSASSSSFECTFTLPSRLSQSLLAVDLVLLVVRFKKNIFLSFHLHCNYYYLFLGITLGSWVLLLQARARLQKLIMCVNIDVSETIRNTPWLDCSKRIIKNVQSLKKVCK